MARIIGFIDFGEEVESGGAGIGDMEEGDVLGGKTMERVSVLTKGLVIGVSWVMRKKMVSGSIRQLWSTLLRTTVILPLSAGRISMWRLDLKELRLGAQERLGCY